MGNPAHRDDYKGPFVFEDVITAEEPRLRPRQATAGGGARMPPSPPAPPSGPTKPPPRGPRGPQGGQPPHVARPAEQAGVSILLVIALSVSTLFAVWAVFFFPSTPWQPQYGCTVRIDDKTYGVPTGGTVTIGGRRFVCR